jgi:NADPH-dependent glutamate synthase beta subunit-like oxidoreductase
MLTAILLMFCIGLIASFALAVASKVFYVWEDPKELAIADTLPGANCGACGYPGCRASATAIATKQAPVNVCMVGGFEVANAVGEIMGIKALEREPDFAQPGCTYGLGEADLIYFYDGVEDCRAATLLYGGSKLCPIGCIGLGTCVKTCQFNALSMGDDNLPVVNHRRCVGCGACEQVCPKGIITLTSTTQRIISEYIADECTSPCERACPTGINIRGYIREIIKGNYEKALLTIKEKCPLPLVCGYICPAPCELNCRRNLIDEPVAINLLKRFAADHEMTTGKHIHPYKASNHDRNIALVGGGTEGLTAAYYLARLGYQPTIFEAKPELGGVLRYIIAEDRLPRNVLDHDIKGILEMGVQAKPNTVMGRDFTVNSLLQDGFDAILLTSGGFDSRKILHSEKKRYDAPCHGLYIMLDFLSTEIQGESIEPSRHVAIVDSSLKSLEVATKCRNLGAKKVTIISDQAFYMLPAEFHETLQLRTNGIKVRPSTIVTSIGGISECINLVTLEDNDPHHQTLNQSEFIEVDTLILSAGRLPELVFVNDHHLPKSTTDAIRWHTIETFHTFPNGVRNGIFSPPEPGRISDSAAVVKSILSGRRLARAVHQHFTDDAIKPVENLTIEADEILDVTEVHDVSPCVRQQPPLCDVEGDSKSAWIFPKELPGLDEQAARREADRCLQCGLICYKKLEKTELVSENA